MKTPQEKLSELKYDNPMDPILDVLYRKQIRMYEDQERDKSFLIITCVTVGSLAIGGTIALMIFG